MNVDISQASSKVFCVFPNSILQHRYSLVMSFDAGNLGTITGGEISNQLVINDQFQVVPTKWIGQLSSDAEVCVYNAVANKTISVRVGTEVKNILTDPAGKACITYLMPNKGNRLLVKANYGRIKSIESAIYLPNYRLSYRGGKAPKVILEARGLPVYSHLRVAMVARSNGAQTTGSLESPDALKYTKSILNVPVAPEIYDVFLYINGVQTSAGVLDVSARTVGGGFRN
jgi:hypothetical protein